jgi:NTP pyrophosphatase (non-canonical NTP hydrolase)
MDSQTTIAELQELVRQFVAERDWQQFHAPKNLSMALAVEVAELMEHFQWRDVEQSRRPALEPVTLQAITDEMADVLCYVLAMANELEIDVGVALREKMKKNERKYPAGEFRGRYE